ncbi:hypothetical protein SEUCBS140593_007541 [Sporothrix eucalyptigena]|uniref:Protein NO VEIN C-terminal domain-containing protein n=1 Tax=Sporothrix eucalyptigena TaxID=1812306 RepID=A0ABP0CE14_9PEZI
MRELKDKFTKESLIYVADADSPEFDGWYEHAKCLWTTSTRIRGMATLKNIYPGLESFFVKGLGVQTMNAKMVYDKLTGPALSIEETKQTIHTFNALLAERDRNAKGIMEAASMDAAKVFEKKVFPVRLPSGYVQLCQGIDSFALVDRQSLADDFSEQAKFFDFDMDEIRSLWPFIEWAGLGHKYLSKTVREISCVAGDDHRPILSRDRDVRRKARALFSLAVAYNSPRVHGSREKALYALLRHAETIETDQMTSELHLDQDGKVLKVEREAATFHIQEEETGLRIYVPKDMARRELCFNATLPQGICLWMMTDPETMVRGPVMPNMVPAAQAILCAMNISMDYILDYHGIKLADVPEREEDGQDLESLQPLNEETENSPPSSKGTESPLSSVEVTVSSQALTSISQQPVSLYDSDGKETVTSHSNTSSSRQAESRCDGETPDILNVFTPPTVITDDEELYISSLLVRTHISTPAASPVQDDSYSVLLNRLVKAAAQASIPSHGNVSLSTIPSTDKRHSNQWYRDADPIERYKQIGAAGELFVFALLSRLDSYLPGFSLQNWQSTIRGYARSHRLYADIENWSGQETADITYEDVDGTLTALLIDKGYLESETWASARPCYFIEVKTTVNAAVGTPFFMSNHQYDRMQNCSVDSPNYGSAEHDPLRNVYVIVRVFGLGANFVGFQLLVDPERMRRRGELVFKAPESWSVVIL